MREQIVNERSFGMKKKNRARTETYEDGALQILRRLNLGLGEGLDPVRPPSQAPGHGGHRRLLLGRRSEGDLAGPAPRRPRLGDPAPSGPEHQGMLSAGRLIYGWGLL